MEIIKFTEVNKRYGKVQALNSLSMSVPGGSIYGFLGPNGSGKTTTIKIIMNLIFKDSGIAECFGNQIPLKKFSDRRRIGYVSEDFILYNFLTVSEMISLYSGLYGLPESKVRPRAESYTKIFNLKLNHKVQTLSKGMRKILLHILSLSTNPDLLILDEPTDGLDAIVKSHLIELFIDHVSNRGMTIFLSSHILTDVEKICDHVLFIKKGKAYLETTMNELKNYYHIYSIRSKDAINFQILSNYQINRITKTGLDIYDLDIFKPIKEVEVICKENGWELLQKYSIPFENIFVRMMEDTDEKIIN
jgi:ABC-2 type transport system ATP-binding protein